MESQRVAATGVVADGEKKCHNLLGSRGRRRRRRVGGQGAVVAAEEGSNGGRR